MSPAAVGAATPRVEIVAAGNEVLLGDVLDTNSHHLCRLVTALGGAVTRAVLVRDDLGAIAAEVRGVLSRAPALAFTVGGLGPTADDMTLAGLALGLGVPLELHAGAERLVREAYARFAAAGLVPFAELNEARRKMARLPQRRGARSQPRRRRARRRRATRRDHLRLAARRARGARRPSSSSRSTPVFGRIFHAAHYEERTLVVDLQDESAIADILGSVEAAHPEVYVKSRAKVMGPAVPAAHHPLGARRRRGHGRRPAARARRRAPRADRGRRLCHLARGA